MTDLDTCMLLSCELWYFLLKRLLFDRLFISIPILILCISYLLLTFVFILRLIPFSINISIISSFQYHAPLWNAVQPFCIKNNTIIIRRLGKMNINYKEASLEVRQLIKGPGVFSKKVNNFKLHTYVDKVKTWYKTIVRQYSKMIYRSAAFIINCHPENNTVTQWDNVNAKKKGTMWMFL